MTNTVSVKNYQNPNHPGNKIRPNIKCLGCKKLGCITAWGPWCFECNNKRMDRLSASFDKLADDYGLKIKRIWVSIS